MLFRSESAWKTRFYALGVDASVAYALLRNAASGRHELIVPKAS